MHVFSMMSNNYQLIYMCVTSDILLEVMFSTYHKSNRFIATCCQC